jgi:hypothetical protein
MGWHWCMWWSVFRWRIVAKINCFMLYKIFILLSLVIWKSGHRCFGESPGLSNWY